MMCSCWQKLLALSKVSVLLKTIKSTEKGTCSGVMYDTLTSLSYFSRNSVKGTVKSLALFHAVSEEL